MQVTRHRAQHHPPHDLPLLILSQGRLQDSQGRLHRLAADDQVGQEILSAGKQLANAINASGEPLIDADQGIEALVQCPTGQLLRILRLTVYHRLGQLLEKLF